MARINLPQGGPIQTASSLGAYSRINPDGTVTVRCYICGKSICEVDAGRNKFSTAMCEICSREEAGEIVPADVELQLRSMRLPDGRRVPMSAITPQPVVDPMIGTENKVGRPEFWWSAVVRKVEVAAAKVVAKSKRKKRYIEQTAQELADEKRHKPLFSGGIEVNIKRNKKE